MPSTKSISILISIFSLLGLQAHSQGTNKVFSVWDFFYPSSQMQTKVDSLFSLLNPEQQVGQLIILSVGKLGKPIERVSLLAKKGSLGGVIYLGGNETEYLSYYQQLNRQNTSPIPLLYTLDAEPALLPIKLSSVASFIPTNKLQTTNRVDSAIQLLDSIISRVHVKMNFAPVSDLSQQNEAIGKRSFGSDPKQVFDLNLAFCLRSMQDGIVPVIKHFPGHGYVEGDSHKKLVYIKDTLKELPVFAALMASGMPAVMVGHIAINGGKYATDGLPASLSPKLIQGLIRDSLSYNGLVITDALNMAALQDWKQAPLMALKAGCDLILMPVDEQGFLKDALAEMEKNRAFALQVERSVKKILLLKLLLNLPFN